MIPRNLGEVTREVETFLDGTGQPVDEKIKSLVIGLRRWGVETNGSCQGHFRHGYHFPWVDVNPESFEILRQLIVRWWPVSKSRWVISPMGSWLKVMPEYHGCFRLWANQREAQEFGKWLQQLPDDHFEERRRDS